MREEMGYPIMVTPVSQFVATQAVMNVVGGERWRDVSDEMVRYFLGHFYEPAGAGGPRGRRPRAVAAARATSCATCEPISLEGARERFGAGISEEELLLRLTMPAEQVDAMVAARGEPPPARWRGPGATRWCGCWASWPSASRSRYVRLEKGDDLVVWRRAA